MKKIITKVGDWLRKQFKRSFDVMKAKSHIAVKVTNALKEALNSPVADLLTTIIPGELDNEAKYMLRRILPEVAAKVAIAHNLIQASDDPNTALTKIKEYIESLGGNARRDWWVLFSANLLEALSDGDVTWSELVSLSQMAYNELYKQPA